MPGGRVSWTHFTFSLSAVGHANTTGHYAGHADPDPDLYWEGPAPYGVRKGLLTKFPRWNTFETWLRGAWPTNKNGVAQFTCTLAFAESLRLESISGYTLSSREDCC